MIAALIPCRQSRASPVKVDLFKTRLSLGQPPRNTRVRKRTAVRLGFASADECLQQRTHGAAQEAFVDEERHALVFDVNTHIRRGQALGQAGERAGAICTRQILLSPRDALPREAAGGLETGEQ